MRLTASRVVGFIILAVVGAALFYLMIVLPFQLLLNILYDIIGHPVGKNWEAVEARLETVNMREEMKEHPETAARLRQMKYLTPSLDMQHAVYEKDGVMYKSPMKHQRSGDTCRLYISRKNPKLHWEPKLPNRVEAVIAVMLILSFWAGLVLSAVMVIQAANA